VPRSLREQGIDLVRRPTGGLAVLHDRERTYAVVGALGRDPFRRGVLETYRAISSALEEAMRSLGIAALASAERGEAVRPSSGPACFALTSAHEITVAGRKLVGSAQLRRGRAFLQHGAIPLEADPGRLAAVLGSEVDGRSFTDLHKASERVVRPQELDRALRGAFARRFGVEMQVGELSARERSRATQLRCWKHLSADWTLSGRLGERERKWGPLGSAG
jgi:lipoate-protein ligase A